MTSDFVALNKLYGLFKGQEAAGFQRNARFPAAQDALGGHRTYLAATVVTISRWASCLETGGSSPLWD